MKFLFIQLTFFSLFVSCGSIQKREREPSSLKLNYTCQNIISYFYERPYGKDYSLERYSFDGAVKAFNRNLESRLPRLKPGSIPFIKTQPGNNPGPTVLLIHGFSDSAGSMREIADMYYERGYHVVAILLNDHGLKGPYQKEALANSHLDKWRADVDFGAAIARSLSDDGKIHLGGYSMGSSLVMDLSFRFPNLVASRTLYAPLFRENGPVYTFAVYFIKLFKKFFYKDIDETEIFYKVMSYQMTIEMHRLTRQLRPRILRQHDEIPTAVFRAAIEDETTVDNEYIDAFVRAYDLERHHHTFDSSGLPAPVLHRDLPAPTINSTGESNPALDFIRRGLFSFLNTIDRSSLR